MSGGEDVGPWGNRDTEALSRQAGKQVGTSHQHAPYQGWELCLYLTYNSQDVNELLARMEADRDSIQQKHSRSGGE